MQIVLPNESANRSLSLTRFVHPKTGELAQFAVDLEEGAPHKLYELTRVGDGERSCLVGGNMAEDGSLVVATPLNPLFLVIPGLYNHRNKSFALDLLLELCSGSEGPEVPEQLVAPSFGQVCDEFEGKWVLNMDKLKQFLDTRSARVQAGLPSLVRTEVLRAVQPIDPTASVSSELVQLAEFYGAVSMVATSWLSEPVAEWYISTHDFSALVQAASQQEEQKATLQYVQMQPQKRSNNEVPKKAKKMKVSNNASILDMFKKK